MVSYKKFLSLVAAGALTFSLAACGSSDETSSDSESGTDEAVTLNMWNGFTGPDGEILQEIVDDFNETNDKNITVKMDIMAWANLNEKLPTAISTKTAPEFVLLNYGDFASYVKNGAVQPIDDFWDYEGVDKSDFSETAVDLGIVDDQQYYIPMQVQGMFLYWNKDLFTAAGLDPETPPATWDEVAEFAPLLADAGNNVSGFAIPTDGNPILYNWILNSGGDISNLEEGFASDETLQVLETIQTMIYDEKAGPQNIGGAEVDNLLMAGQLAMEMNGPWLNTGLQKNEINYGVTTLPPGLDGSKSAILDGVGFAIPTSTDDSKKDAIYEFVKYWNSTEIGKKWSMENGFPAYLTSVAEDPEVKADPIVSELTKQIEYAKPFMPGSAEIPEINNNVIKPLIESLLAGEDPETLMNEADKQIKEIFEASK